VFLSRRRTHFRGILGTLTYLSNACFPLHSRAAFIETTRSTPQLSSKEDKNLGTSQSSRFITLQCCPIPSAAHSRLSAPDLVIGLLPLRVIAQHQIRPLRAFRVGTKLRPSIRDRSGRRYAVLVFLHAPGGLGIRRGWRWERRIWLGAVTRGATRVPAFGCYHPSFLPPQRIVGRSALVHSIRIVTS